MWYAGLAAAGTERPARRPILAGRE